MHILRSKITEVSKINLLTNFKNYTDAYKASSGDTKRPEYSTRYTQVSKGQFEMFTV